MRSEVIASYALLALLVSFGCGSSSSPAGAVSGRVTAAGGGTLIGSTGIVLTVPPGAVERDTDVSVIPISASSENASWIAGVRFEPDGLVLLKPATLRLPLPAARSAGAAPLDLEFNHTDPKGAYESGFIAELSDDGAAAILEVRHFSGKICAENCHAGTREFLLASFLKHGHSPDEVAARIKSKFPGVDLPTTCTSIGWMAAEAMLDTFFDDIGGYDEGTDVPPEVLKRLADAAAAGKNVAVAFKQHVFGPRGGSFNFYDRVAHTAVVEQYNGQWQIRNALVVGGVVLKALGGTNLAYWPLADLNGFRRARQGVAVEVQACGAPGCLGPEGIDPGDPQWPYLPLETRQVPWSAVRLYIEHEWPSCPAFVEVRAGHMHTCARREDGTGWCWGGNAKGQLGDGTTTDRSSPVQVMGLSGAIGLAAGFAHTCALKADQSVWCWGDNDYGDLGNGAILPSSTPVQVHGLGGVTQIAVGQGLSCALKSGDRSVWCWGGGGIERRVPYRITLNTPPMVPPATMPTYLAATEIAAGSAGACAIAADGTVRCWGSGQLSDRQSAWDGGDADPVVAISGSPPTFLSGLSRLAIGQSHACGLASDGGVRCWGSNSFGQIGNGSNGIERTLPTTVVDLGAAIEVATSASAVHTCARKSDGTAWCWGSNLLGELGSGDFSGMSARPVQVVGIVGAQQLTTGESHTCALTAAGISCWGGNQLGQLGVGKDGGMLWSQRQPTAVLLRCP